MRVLLPCILVISCILVVLLYVSYNTQQARTQTVLFERLNPYHSPPITHNDISYTISETGLEQVSTPYSNKLLQLAYFSTAARIDPLLAFPGTDIGLFLTAITELEEAQERMVSVYGPEDGEILSEVLYPISFLRHLYILEELRRYLISYPTFKGAEEYQKKFTDTYEVYIESIEKLQYAIRTHSSDEFKESLFEFYPGTTDIPFILNTLEQYKKGITQIYTKQINRFKCYKGNVSHCFTITRPPPPQITYPIVSDGYKEKVEYHREIIKTLKQSPHRTNTYKYPHTDIEIYRSRCTRRGGPGYYHLWWREYDSGVVIFKPRLLEELLFYDFGDENIQHWGHIHIHQLLGGPRYIHQPLTSHYFCFEAGVDMSHLLSILYVAEKRLRISSITPESRKDIDLLIDAVNRAYDEIPDSGSLTQEMIEQYISALHTLLISTTESDLYDYLGNTTTQALHDLVTVYYTKTASFSEVLLSVVNESNILLKRFYFGTRPSLYSLLVVRTVPIVFFGGFTPTIQPYPLSFIEEDLVGLPYPQLFTLSEFLTLSNLNTKDITSLVHLMWEDEPIRDLMYSIFNIAHPSDTFN